VGTVNQDDSPFPQLLASQPIKHRFPTKNPEDPIVEASAVTARLEYGDVCGAQRYVARIVGRDTAQLDAPEIARATIETLAESACDGIIAPLLALAIGGVPLALAFKAASTLDSMIGHIEPPYTFLGRASARLDDVACYLPARITAFLIAGCAPLVGADARRAFAVLRADGHRHRSPNAGRPEAAMAGALGVRLGGCKPLRWCCSRGRVFRRGPCGAHDRRRATGRRTCRRKRGHLRRNDRRGALRPRIAKTSEIVTAKFVGENDSTPAHGGDLVAIGRRYGVDPASLLDFSANVNPAGPPAPLLRALEAGVRDVAALGRYPDPDAASLRYALARTFDIEPEAIIVANGAAALISTALAALRPGRCVVPTPAFSEYRFAIRAAGAQFYALPLDAEVDFALDPQRVCAAVCGHAAEVCVITNPHNPSGSLTAPGILGSLVTAVRGLGTATIVDEAFIDYSPSSSITREAATTPQLVVIRSLTKFFGVPSLRVGYAVAHPDFVRRMRAQLPS
jgi:hypothetical protein